MVRRTCDVAVVGAGTAGLAAERSARRAGAKTLLIDEAFSGTTCARVGCMPSKLLIAAAAAAHASHRAGVFGVNAQVRIDGAAVIARVRRERDAFVESTLNTIRALPAEIRVQANAQFKSATILRLSNGDEVHCRATVIATGSRPQIPFAYRALQVITNESIFELQGLPASLAVIGSGALGLELAQAFARLGVRVHVFDANAHIGGLHDREVAIELESVLGREMTCTLGVKIHAIRDERGVSIAWTGVSSGQQYFERVLVATGRPPTLELNLAATGIALDEQGTPDFDRCTLQCGDSPIFLAGDADGERAQLHEASAEGALAGSNAASYPRVTRTTRTSPFTITFTDPPIAVLGAMPTAHSVTGQASYAAQGRATVEARNKGLIRIYADRQGTLTGATLFAPGADHFAHLIAWAIARGETAAALLKLPFYHPTLEEGLKTALRHVCERLDTPPEPQIDAGNPGGG